MTESPRVLVVDDEPQIVRGLRVVLRNAGFHVDSAGTKEEALDALAHRPPDAVLLDLVLPDGSGVDVCRQVREWSHVPIVVVSAVGDEREKVRALDAGADDYVTKPFSLSVLSARVRVLLRRRGSGEAELDVAGVKVDPGARRAWRDGRELELSPKEFDLLALLVARAGEAVPRDEIMTSVWDENWFGPTKTLDTHVGWLRRKLGDPPLLTTVRGVGFRFEDG
jgi:DNA-binding response OmpR family regulator